MNPPEPTILQPLLRQLVVAVLTLLVTHGWLAPSFTGETTITTLVALIGSIVTLAWSKAHQAKIVDKTVAVTQTQLLHKSDTNK